MRPRMRLLLSVIQAVRKLGHTDGDASSLTTGQMGAIAFVHLGCPAVNRQPAGRWAVETRSRSRCSSRSTAVPAHGMATARGLGLWLVGVRVT
jgi:hypothetical protein